MTASATDALLGYDGRRVVVTGCSSGIGAATAHLLRRLGAEVHGVDVVEAPEELSSFHHLDLREPFSILAAVTDIGGRVDALFSCAGIPPGRPPLDVMKVNFIGTRQLTEAVLPLMPHGSAIVSVGSNGGMGWTNRVPTLLDLVATTSYDEAVAWCEAHTAEVAEGYRFSKEALAVWTLRSSRETIRAGIRLNATAPGAVTTPLLDEIELTTPSAVVDTVAQPIGRRSSPAEQAAVLVMLNSPAAGYVNGALVPVDGGFAASVLAR